jgi:peptide/nickel transport system permease protein
MKAKLRYIRLSAKKNFLIFLFLRKITSYDTSSLPGLNMLEVVRQDYITTAKAKGLSNPTVIFKHALRNALLPVITILGLSIPGLIGGSVIFETIFAIPGMGQLFYASVMARDYPTIMGILVIGAVLTLLGNLIADVSYALADPRIREL